MISTSPVTRQRAHGRPNAAWQNELSHAISDPLELCRLLDLDPQLAVASRVAGTQFRLRVPRGFVRRMRAGDPKDPLLRQVLPFDDYDFYLCGPAAFMQTMYDGLRALNVAADRIRFEAFGPATVRTVAKAPQPTDALPSPGQATVAVRFARSDTVARWDGAHASLLDLAEAHDLAPPSGCRSGLCGACAVPLLAGQVDYIRSCGAQVPDGHVLLCSARPRAGADGAAAPAVTIDL